MNNLYAIPTEEERQGHEAQFIATLQHLERQGMTNLITWLRTEGFFTSPASTRYHGCYCGGLLMHSIHVYRRLVDANTLLELHTPHEAIAIAALLHDVCKVGAYLGDSKPYHWNRQQPKGHALLSLVRISKFIKLTELEEAMIQYHMGVYGLREFDEKKGEYNLRNRSMAYNWHHHSIVKVMYFCDELASLQEKINE